MTRTAWRRLRRPLLIALLVIAALATVQFGVRSYRSYQVLRAAQQLGADDVGSLRGWMSLRYIARTYHVPEPALIARLGLPPDTDPNLSLRALARRQGREVLDLVLETQRAVVEARRDRRGVGGGPSPG